MSLRVESVYLIRKTDIPIADADTFLVEALKICAEDPGELEWQNAGRMERGRGKAMELTITEAWHPGPMLDIRRVRVESYEETVDGQQFKGGRITYDIRGFPDEGRLEFRVDNTRVKSASMEIYATTDNALAAAEKFREMFTEA